MAKSINNDPIAQAQAAAAAIKKARVTKTKVDAAPKGTATFIFKMEEDVELHQLIMAGLFSIDNNPITAGMYATVKFDDFKTVGTKEMCQVTFKTPTRTNWVKFGKVNANVATMWSKSWKKLDEKKNPVVVNGKQVYEYSKFSNVNGTRMPDGDWKTEGRPREMDIRKAAIAVLKAFHPDMVVADRVY